MCLQLDSNITQYILQYVTSITADGTVKAEDEPDLLPGKHCTVTVGRVGMMG